MKSLEVKHKTIVAQRTRISLESLRKAIQSETIRGLYSVCCSTADLRRLTLTFPSPSAAVHSRIRNLTPNAESVRVVSSPAVRRYIFSCHKRNNLMTEIDGEGNEIAGGRIGGQIRGQQLMQTQLCWVCNTHT